MTGLTSEEPMAADPKDVDFTRSVIEHAKSQGVSQTLHCFLVAMGLLGERVSLKWSGQSSAEKRSRK
jgi:hypothetical protein